TPRLNLTYGLRWELTPPPTARQSSASAGAPWHTRYTQFAPRIGAAFRAGQNSVIRAGWGVFYDVAFSTALDPINGSPFNRWQFGSGSAAAAPASGFGFRYASGLRLPYSLQWNLAYE